jgi:hypothetical protein
MAFEVYKGHYGRGYYSNIPDLIVGLQHGCAMALQTACGWMEAEGRDIIQERLYDAYHSEKYDRTGETLDTFRYVKDKKDSEDEEYSEDEEDSLKGTFEFDDDVLSVAPDDNVNAHRYLLPSPKYPSGIPTSGMMKYYSRDGMHEDIMFEINRMIRDDFPELYRRACKQIYNIK